MADYPPLSLGIICTPQEYARSLAGTSIKCLTRGESIGLTCVAAAGLLSLIAILYAFLIILRNIVWRIRNVTIDRLHIFQRPVDLLMFSLFVADVLQAAGAVMNLKWVQDGKVEVGNFCDVQGTVQQLGETGVAMTTLIIAVYTFLGVWMGKDIRSMTTTRVILGVAWSFILLMIILGSLINRGNGVHYQAPTPYWCWINDGYLQWRIWGQYFWFWITLAISFAIYIPLYLWSRGNIRIDDDIWWKFTFQRANKDMEPTLQGVRRRALVMLVYPVLYCFSILPLSIVRWMSFVHPNSVPGAATLAVASIYWLSGAFNVVLLLTTRPESVLFGKPSNFSFGTAPLGASEELLPSGGHPERPKVDLEDSEEDSWVLGRLPSR